jgi:hypothetical protein
MALKSFQMTNAAVLHLEVRKNEELEHSAVRSFRIGHEHFSSFLLQIAAGTVRR